MKYIISVLCLDRPGIVFNMSSAVARQGGNIDDMRQDVIEGYFTGVMAVTFENDCNIDKLKEDMNITGEGEVSIIPYKENDFAFETQEKYVLTVSCKEQKGIVAAITSYLYDNKINIDSISAFAEGDKFVIVTELSVPGSKAALKIKNDIRKIGKGWDLSVHLSHENIYLATNTICPTVRIGKKI